MQVSIRRLATASVACVATLLAACAQPGPVGAPPPPPPGSAYQNSSSGYAQRYGRVTNVEYMRGSPSQGVAGAVVGGAVGGLAGNQVGHGHGRAAATVAGVVGGALIGNLLERNMNRNNVDYYRVTVQFDQGGIQQFDYAQAPDVRIGDRVRADGDQLYR